MLSASLLCRRRCPTIALSRQGWQAQKLISALGTNNINATNAYYRIRNSYYVDSIG